jgi:mannose/fructose/N-acetylgalactosamine-specific phosphotransferase system component IIC
MITHWFTISLAMALLSLDETTVGQFMLSRPIVTGPLVGWLCGQPGIGLEMGALIELIWINDLPVGAHLPIDLTMLTGVSVAFTSSLLGGNYPTETAITYALGISIPLAALSSEAEIVLRKFNVRWVHFAERMAQNSHFRTFDWINYFVLVEFFLKGFLVSAACLAAAHFSAKLFYLFPIKVLEGFYYAHWLLLALGCSAAIDLLVEKKNAVFLILSVITMMSLAILWPVQGIWLTSLALAAGLILMFYFVGKGGTA